VVVVRHMRYAVRDRERGHGQQPCGSLLFADAGEPETVQETVASLSKSPGRTRAAAREGSCSIRRSSASDAVMGGT
jgi:hypothetical protein